MGSMEGADNLASQGRWDHNPIAVEYCTIELEESISVSPVRFNQQIGLMRFMETMLNAVEDGTHGWLLPGLVNDDIPQ